MPVGIKNPTDGNIDTAISACLVANEAHQFIGIDEDARACLIETEGNPLAHLVLRGSDTRTNYDPVSIQTALRKLQKAHLLDALIVDCSHGNSQKNYLQQVDIFNSLLTCSRSNICGIMFESFIDEGTYLLGNKTRSITDPCLDWETSKRMILKGADLLRQKALTLSYS